MQIDYHHAATYICCRLAGMSKADAAIVAHASQYVDDATNDGPLAFSSGERYVRVTSAHKTFDIRLNADAKDNRLVWVPFHFLPGNDTPRAGQGAAEAFVTRMVCRPNSVIANDLVADAIARQDLSFALHRLGITLHTYIDTWAHQGFVGMVDDFNRVAKITITPDPVYATHPIFGDLTSATTKISALVANHLPVGHAGVVTMPDLPFLRWSFRRENGEQVARDNPSEFLDAATHMFNAVRQYVAKSTNLDPIHLSAADAAEIARLTRTTLAIDGEERHAAWIRSIAQGAFSFGAEQVTYVESGPGSWKYTAIGADPDAEDGTEKFEYSPAFLTSDWKRFHDAVQYQRLFILHDLLPRHGIVAS
jgi:hypothetical protein